mmetsp:Transcript_11562/g.21358  ORF Transcript_11562/g.21358 Transcript_11562/m.21358 type:complete len:261 (+) Transcript_11562:141-923(+)|eukprot:CAMPEP_0201931826 /NCGR_PEP_ID=MMETSP0903-20130614/28198_1 /ASSEMBLY_ACC=CAM_ASM_000552 /TAXON_ID=420261 /ORGANISM="Thalassiosira antarctica, Strain CCMP982" /LENGTH=260 /DNA_ID=CAMNT_0048471255 /DNA_START=128 /DNA_END=910 /DNA_ORIENTATION=+
MILRFDRKSERFAEPALPSASIATNVRHLLNEVIGGNHGRNTRHGFNDLGFYMNLCAQDGCSKVELCDIDIHHNDEFCHGIQAVYRSKFSNGDVSISKAPVHAYNRGYYAYTGGQPQVSRLTFEDGEYLAEIRTRQGDITDQIALVTNHRTVCFGGWGGNGEDTSLPTDLTRRIIAFAGTSNWVLARLGAISISRNWEVIGPIVLLRALVEQRRASLLELERVGPLIEDEVVVRAFIVELSEDVLRRTLSFLAPGIKVSD